jgi:hypothetical protein
MLRRRVGRHPGYARGNGARSGTSPREVRDARPGPRPYPAGSTWTVRMTAPRPSGARALPRTRV